MTLSDKTKLINLALMVAIGCLIVLPFLAIYVAHNNPPSPVAGYNAPWVPRK